MPKVLITHNNELLENFFNLDAVEQIRQFAEVQLNGTDEPLAGEALIRAAQGADVILSDRLAPGTEPVFAALPKLVAYLRCAVDIRNIDVAAASRHGVLVVRSSSGYAEAVAEVALGLMITLARRMHVGDQFYKLGQDSQPMVMTRQLAGASMGLIGYGGIGKRIAELAIAFGMRIHVYDPYVRVVNGCLHQTSLEEVLGQDFVVCAAYATPETERMMNSAAFARMKNTTYFINVSRGILVDEDALEEALVSGGIAGAGLDVGLGHDQQPSLRIAKLPNVVAVPHVAGLTREASNHQAFENVGQIREILAGKPPALSVNARFASRLDRMVGH